ncbi:MAG: hypothetical protein HY874_10475, partial [Chloroflexi bacterium]|nr:hypothetical protein [Chloroflexota bacterium]
MASPRIISGTLPALEDALAEAVALARGGDDPLAPVTVVVGHVLLRPYLRRMLAARGIPQINVEFVLPHEFARRLAPASPARPRLSPGAEGLLVREIAAGAGGYFREIAGREGFAEALGRLFRDLERGGFSDGGFAAAAAAVKRGSGANGAKLDALCALYREFLRRTESFARPAADYRDADPARIEGPVLVYGLWAQARELDLLLLDRVARAGVDLTILLPASGGTADDATAPFGARMSRVAAARDAAEGEDTPLQRLAAGVFSAHETAVDAGGAVALVSAPDTVREVWEAARACMAWAQEGIAFHEMAVVYRNRDPYRALVDEIFSEAQIPTYLHDGRLFSAHPLGRRLLALLDLAADAKFGRAKVMEFLTETRVSRDVLEAHKPFRPSEWETYTREAGIVDGAEQWKKRLERLAGEKRENAKLENYEWQAGVADRIDVFGGFVAEFHGALTAHAEEASWEEHLAYLRGLASRYAAGTEPLLDALGDLATLAAVTPRATFAVFCRAVRDDLESRDTTQVLKEPVRQFGRQGVAVMDATSARHLRFRAVHMLGVAERAWPPPARPDPLLLEHERRALNEARQGVLRLRTEPDDEPLTFWLGIQAARERLGVSYARAEAGGSGKHLPSYFFRTVAEALEGGRLSLDEVEGSRHVRRFHAGRLASDAPGESLSPAEYDRGLVRASIDGEEDAAVA